MVRLVDPTMTAAMGEYVRFRCCACTGRMSPIASSRTRRGGASCRSLAAGSRRVGILGLGVLGSEAALRLKVLGFDVAGWSRSERRLKGILCFHGSDGLPRLAARSDILVCLLPLTQETENILDARLFAALPHGAAIVNCGRGAHLVEGDLLAALASGQVSAAVLDVFRREPLPPDHPFWRHQRILVTPHAAAATTARTAAAIVAAALRRFAAGETIANLVERRRGY